jgi:hydroxyacylglutathione hydrolase
MTPQPLVHQLKVQQAPFKNYTYLVIDRETRTAAIVDPAWEPEPILAAIRSLDVRLDAILLTHSHFDHVNLVESLSASFAPCVYMHRREIDFYGYSCRNLIALDHQDVVRVGATEIRCLKTPGHTAGSACFVAGRALFSGDTLFTEGCGVCDTHGGSAEAMFGSMQLLKATIAGDVAVYPGHSFGKEPGHTFEYLLRNNVYLNIPDEKRFVQFRMRAVNPRTYLEFH